MKTLSRLVTFVLLLRLIPCLSFSQRTPPPISSCHKVPMANKNELNYPSRRQVVADASLSGLAGALLTTLVYTSSVGGAPAQAAETTSTPPTLTVQSMLQGLRRVPTFCIVNDQGAAYMLYKPNEGFAKGYAFITYEGAELVLKDARVTAERDGYADTWKPATITTLPADVALRLTLQPKQRTSQRDQSASTILFLIPGAADREAAMQIDKQKFKDQGKVPLFYLDTYRNAQGALPLYFNPRDLVQDWQASSGADSTTVPPRIQVVDLVTMFGFVVRGRAAELPTALQSNPLVFIPNPQVVQKAKELEAQGLVPYKLDKMIV